MTPPASPDGPSWAQELLGPPEHPVGPTDWAALTRRTGLEFPADYREFADLYPALNIDEYLLIHHPAGPAGFDLADDAARLLARLEAWGPPEEVVEFDPDTGRTTVLTEPVPVIEGLFPWGGNYTLDAIGLWATDDPDPARWTIMIAGFGSRWHYRGPLTRFLPDILTGLVTCPWFPDDWPDPEKERDVHQIFD